MECSIIILVGLLDVLVVVCCCGWVFDVEELFCGIVGVVVLFDGWVFFDLLFVFGVVICVVEVDYEWIECVGGVLCVVVVVLINLFSVVVWC